MNDNDDVAKIPDASVSEDGGTFVFHVASVESIRDQVQMDSAENASLDEDIDDKKMNSETRTERLSLDPMLINEIHRTWEDKLPRFVVSPTKISTLLKSRHSTHEERMNEYEKALKFINRCYESQEVVSVLCFKAQDEEFDSAETAKDSPVSTVVPGLARVNTSEFSERLSLEEICEQSSYFKNIRTPEDVAVFEYCVNEFYLTSMKIYRDKKERCKDGGLVEVLFHEPSVYSRSSNACAAPCIFRISPTLTVFRLRKLLAEQFGAYLQSTNIQEQRISATSAEDPKEDVSKDYDTPMQDHLNDK